MKLNVLVAVDFHNARVSQLAEFDAEMADREWIRFPNLKPVFCTTVEGAPSDAEVLEAAQADCAQSAKAADISDWDGVCVLSPSETAACAS